MDRKIMVEVTPQEYNKIIAGGLDLKDASTKDLVNELLTRLNDRKVSTQNNFYSYGIGGMESIITGNIKIDEMTSVEVRYYTRGII